MNKNKKIVFGLGTGRCGTMSLSELLSHQKNSIISHELGGLPWLSWKKDKNKFTFFMNKVLDRRCSFVGDVSFYSLPYWKEILNLGLETKFVIIKRDKKETIDSYMKKTINQNPFMSHDGTVWRHYEWDHCYPKMLSENKERAISMYYDYYYEMCKEIPNELAYWIDTKDLNNKEASLDLLNWCGFEKPEFMIMKKNKGKK